MQMVCRILGEAMQGITGNPPFRVRMVRLENRYLSIGWLRRGAGTLVAGAIFMLATILPSAAQDDSEVPLISAPAYPGRANPLAQPGLTPSPPQVYNSFAASGAPTPDIATTIPESLPVVVELFTSQGCSSCPPADRMMAVLDEMPNVIPLSIHVDYWDYLGWADSFAKPEFTKRQEAYARAAGEHSLYTPQMIFDGQDTAVSPGPAQLIALIDARRAAPAQVHSNIESGPDGDRITIMPLTDLAAPVDVMLVRYVPERTVKIKAGENRGYDATYVNVVLSIKKLTGWDGRQPLTLTVKPGDQPDPDLPLDTKNLIFVQEALGPARLPGMILAAIGLD